MTHNIRDLAYFAKLFKVQIPYHAEADYYFDTLARSAEFAWLPQRVVEFEAYEHEIEEAGYASVPVHTKDVLDTMVAYIVGFITKEVLTNSPNLLYMANQNPDLRKVQPDDILVSIDLCQASLNVIKDYGMGPIRDWAYICNHVGAHPILSKSKSFRQRVFGHIIPKHIRRLINDKTRRLFEVVSPMLGGSVVATHDDEFVVLRPNIQHMDQIEHELNMYQARMQFFHISPCGGAPNRWVKSMLDEQHNVLYKKLVGVPGNQFYEYFKRFVLEEDVEDRDLLFWNDGRLAKWVAADA